MIDNPVSTPLIGLLSSLEEGLVWVAVGIILLLTTIYTIVFLYHWKKYSINTTTLPYITVIVYLSGTILLLFTIIGAAFTI